MTIKLPPPPVGSPPNAYAWADWWYKLRELINNSELDHNALNNLQGGSTNERYHLTQAEYNTARNAMTLKGIQRGVINITGTSTSATATITAVNTAKTELRFLGVTQDPTTSQTDAYLTLTNSTTITASRISPGSSVNAYVSWELTEYN